MPRAAIAGALLACLLGGAQCGRNSPEPILGRPAVTAAGPRRIAFTARGRVWVADAADTARATMEAVVVPGETHQDRPVWLPDGEGLALSSWFGGQADLAVYAGGRVHRLTLTAAGEVLNDVAADGRFLFERDGHLLEMPVTRAAGASPPGTWRAAGPERILTNGRDGRYTPDGRHVLFVRGLDREPLGIWRQGYAGGDDSEVFFLDLATRAIFQITDNPDNDEMPVPLDDAGRRFIVCHQRNGPYRPWLVDVLSPRLHRVRRFPSPDGVWPALSPAVRRGPDPEELELWFEADGRLYRTAGAVRDTGLAFAPAAEVHVALPQRKGAASEFGVALFREASHWLASNPSTADRWRSISGRERRRFASEMARAMSSEAAEDLLARLLGRLALPGLYILPARVASLDRRDEGVEQPGNRGVEKPGGAGAPDSALAAALDRAGMAYAWLPRLGPDIASALEAMAQPEDSVLVLDLRQTWGGSGADSLLALLCGPVLAPRPARAVIVLVTGKTHGEGEVFAAELRARGCGQLVGRTTAGSVPTELHVLRSGGALVMPLGTAIGRERRPSDGRGVPPDIFVPELANPGGEPWLESVFAAVSKGSARRAPRQPRRDE